MKPTELLKADLLSQVVLLGSGVALLVSLVLAVVAVGGATAMHW